MSLILEKILQTFEDFPTNIAYQIEDNKYSYKDFQLRIATITNQLNSNEFKDQLFIGIDASEIASFETYCQIFACLFSGKCFIPINLSYPKERVEHLIKITEIKTILTNEKTPDTYIKIFKNEQVNFINSNKLSLVDNYTIQITNIPDNQFAYILFTSGSTGVPKGVPLTRSNLFGFVENFVKLGYHIKPSDKFIQMFEFTFDLSIFSYLIPSLFGASVYPISSKGVKLANTLNIMMDYNITVALVVPSILSFLKPYYDEIELQHLRYLFFCGEALSNDLSEKFSKCIPNARIVNFYGPTEATIFCTYYEWKKEKKDSKHYNGAVTIGKAFPNMYTIILDENNSITRPNVTGELCLAGNQLTKGYFKNEEKNKETFLELNYNSENLRLYRTGDLAFYDGDGDIMFCGRKDSQVKIQGYRVELGEIEHNLRKLFNNDDVVVIANVNSNNLVELHCVIKGEQLQLFDIHKKVNEVLPAYMQPKEYHFIKDFPLNNNGKVDRNKLKELF